MAQVPLASRTMHLDTFHAETAIIGIADVGLIDRLKKARPARARFEFCVDQKKVRAATGAAIESLLDFLAGDLAKRSLGPVFAQHMVLFLCEDLLPFIF